MNTSEVFRLPWSKPPLTANQRLYWAQRATTTRVIRYTTSQTVRNFPPCELVEVDLIWFVKDKRRRDVDNLLPTFKACCDGVVDAGIVKDDTPEFMVKNMPQIKYIEGLPQAYMALIISEVL